ncbi:Uncharacterised protein [uncultured archaeon]|nr:Uncharacterised protein [uncultured archaeon]
MTNMPSSKWFKLTAAKGADAPKRAEHPPWYGVGARTYGEFDPTVHAKPPGGSAKTFSSVSQALSGATRKFMSLFGKADGKKALAEPEELGMESGPGMERRQF